MALSQEIDKHLLENSSKIDLSVSEILTNLSEALQQIPVLLLRNSYASTPRRQLTFKDLHQLCETNGVSLRYSPSTGNHICDITGGPLFPGVNAKSGASLLTQDTEIIQPISTKIQVLFEAFDLMVQLLRVDHVVCVTSLQSLKLSSTKCEDGNESDDDAD